MIDHVNAVVLPVRDVEKCTSFYRDKLGFKLNNKDAESAFFSIDGKKGGLVLGLISVNEVAKLISEKQVRPKEDAIHRTYYAVFVDDVDREYEELKAKGVRFIKPPTTQPWGQRIAYFEDPEGNLWEISHFPKKST
jgi:lactoylglutathione lyase